jgi:site-specific DNA-methyltransferase (adenine-specific)
MIQDPDKMNGVWVTPLAFFEPLQKEFNLDVDAAASPDNAMLPRFWTEQNDALKQDWRGLRVWCNPPYGLRGKKNGLYRWVEKFASGGAEIVVALLAARTDTLWFHDFIWKKPGVEIRFVKGRIHFSGADDGGKFPSMVVIFRRPQ